MTVSPSISIRTPVSTGRVSSRPAAMATCAAAAAKTSPGTVPVAVGICGSAGYSSTGRVCRVNREEPQTTRRPHAVCGDLHRAVGKRTADVGEQPAGDQDGAVLLDLRLDRDPRRDLVVEAGEAQLRPPPPSAAGPRGRAPADGPGGCGPSRPPPPRVHRAPPGSSPEPPPAVARLALPALRPSALLPGTSLTLRHGQSVRVGVKSDATASAARGASCAQRPTSKRFPGNY